MLILFGAYECVACYRVANTDMCKLHATRGVYVKMGCSEKYVKSLTFPKAGKVDGAGQGGGDFYQAIFCLFSPIAQDDPVLNVACFYLMSK